MRKRILSIGLLMTALTMLVFLTYRVAAEPDAQGSATTGESSPIAEPRAKIADARNVRQLLERIAKDEATHRADDVIQRAKVAAGANANATLSLDLIPNGGSGNQQNDGVTSGTVSGRGTTIAIEVFATGVTTSLVGIQLQFDFDATLLTFVKAENSAFPLNLPQPTGTDFAATSPVTLPSSNFLARAEFTTATDVTGREFSIGLASVILSESQSLSDRLTTTNRISFNLSTTSTADFDGDGMVGFSDFLAFVGYYGTRQGDGRYQARYDLNSDGRIDFSDFLIFAGSFGDSVPPPNGENVAVDIPDATLRAVIADSLGKAPDAPISRSEMATLISFDADSLGISDLTGLEFATSLTYLDISDNSISDISALSGLTRLEWLSLSRTSISDISALSGLTRLEELYLSNTSISDISVLSRLTELETLYLSDNSISDISALSRLTELETLSLSRTSISDISALSGLTALEGLVLDNTSISDISALSGLTNLILLILYDTPLSATSRYTHIPNIQARGTIVFFNSSGGNDGGVPPKMYWTDNSLFTVTHKIQRADLDGSNIEDLATSWNPYGIALDVGSGKMYWTDWSTDKIQRANMDGTQVEDLVTTGLEGPSGIALDVGSGKMYWTDNGLFTGKIQRANMDGTQVEDLITTGLSGPRGIVLDVGSGKMYWTDGLFTEKIQRANLDGSQVEDLITTGLKTSSPQD